jgi:putative membrane protein
MLTEEQETRINAAVKEAEKNTSGEIFCILTQRTSEYVETPVAYGALGALLIPLGLVAFGVQPWAWMGWGTGEVSPESAVLAYTLLQAAAFLITLGIVSIRKVRLMLAPEPLKRSRVRRAAFQQFLAKGLHQTRDRTGVLIFAAVDERRAEVIADEGVYSQVSNDIWTEALEALARGLKADDPEAGFIEAVRICGEVLAKHFPPKGDNPNELPDQIITL